MPNQKPKLPTIGLSAQCDQVKDSTTIAAQAQKNGGASTNGGMTRDLVNAIGISLEMHTARKKTLESILKEGYYMEEAQNLPPKERFL